MLNVPPLTLPIFLFTYLSASRIINFSTDLGVGCLLEDITLPNSASLLTLAPSVGKPNANPFFKYFTNW